MNELISKVSASAFRRPFSCLLAPAQPSCRSQSCAISAIFLFWCYDTVVRVTGFWVKILKKRIYLGSVSARLKLNIGI